MRKGARKPGLGSKLKVKFRGGLEWLSSTFSFMRKAGAYLDEVIDEKVWRILRSKRTGKVFGAAFKWPLNFFGFILFLTILALLIEKIPAIDELSSREKSMIILAITMCIVSSFIVLSLDRGKKKDEVEVDAGESEKALSLSQALNPSKDEVVGEGKTVDAEKVEEVSKPKLFNFWWYTGALVFLGLLIFFFGERFFYALGILLALGLLFCSIGVIRRKSEEKKPVVFPWLVTVISFAMIVSLSYLMFKNKGCDAEAGFRCPTPIASGAEERSASWIDFALNPTPEFYPLPDRLPSDTQFVMVATKERRSPKIVIPVYYGIEFTFLGKDQANCIDVYTQLGGPFEMCQNERSGEACPWTRLEDPEIVQVASRMSETRVKIRLYDSRVATSQRVC